MNLDFCGAGKEDPTTFFNDGVRKIDFVLVFEETLKSEEDFDTAGLATNAVLLVVHFVSYTFVSYTRFSKKLMK